MTLPATICAGRDGRGGGGTTSAMTSLSTVNSIGNRPANENNKGEENAQNQKRLNNPIGIPRAKRCDNYASSRIN